jgi:hypothetical protein
MLRLLPAVILSLAMLATSAEAAKLRIAMIPKGTTHVFWKTVEAGARAAAAYLDVELVWKGPLKENDRGQQIAIVEQFVTEGVSAIILAPLDAVALRRPVAMAAQHGHQGAHAADPGHPAMFHLYTHAFFKALLFLGSGAVIYACHHEQDIWKMGGLRKHMPVTFWTFAIGTAALMGVPFLSGFWSKEAVLGAAYDSGCKVLFLVGAATAALILIHFHISATSSSSL